MALACTGCLAVVECDFGAIRHGPKVATFATPGPTDKLTAMAPFRQYRSCILLFLSALVVPVALGAAAGPPVNVNIRRATATSDGADAVSASATAGQGPSKQWGGVSLDLTGEFSCHVSSPDGGGSTGDVEDKVPLFRLGSNRHQSRRVPTIHAGGRYDFSKAWYGVTRVFGSLSWHGRKVNGVIEANHDEVESPGSSSSALERMRTNLSRCTMTFRAEKDILETNDNAIQLCLKKRLDSNDEPYQTIAPSLTLRVENSHVAGDSASVALLTPIHPRLDIVSKTTVMLDLDGDDEMGGIGPAIKQRELFSSRVPKVLSREDWETGSWLPDVKLSPTGWLAAKTEAGIPPSRTSAPSGNKSGVRLSVNRQVPWSMWGSQDDDETEEHNTWIRLQFCGTSENNFYSASVDAALERVVDSLRITLAHEKVVESPSWA